MSVLEKRSESADTALEIMRDWNWNRCDPDGVPFRPGMDLNVVVNRLAMTGLFNPESAILSLLCSGKMHSSGEYRWQKYQRGKFYQFESVYEKLDQIRWKILKKAISDHDDDDGFMIPVLNLERLNMKACRTYEWEFNNNRFSTAIRPIGNIFDPDYYEEWYSAWGVEIWPNDTLPDYSIDDDDQYSGPVKITNKGGRPPAAEWESAALDIAGRFYRGDFKPQNIADVARELASWLGERDINPSDSVIRVHAKRIFDAFQAWDND